MLSQWRNIMANPPGFTRDRHMKRKTKRVVRPRCIIIAGPNGAGKTTFARDFLPLDAGIVHFVNADLIASGLSPLRPEIAALTAGRLFLTELDRLADVQASFAFESTFEFSLCLSAAGGFLVCIR